MRKRMKTKWHSDLSLLCKYLGSRELYTTTILLQSSFHRSFTVPLIYSSERDHGTNLDTLQYPRGILYLYFIETQLQRCRGKSKVLLQSPIKLL